MIQKKIKNSEIEHNKVSSGLVHVLFRIVQNQFNNNKEPYNVIDYETKDKWKHIYVVEKSNKIYVRAVKNLDYKSFDEWVKRALLKNENMISKCWKNFCLYESETEEFEIE